jgi:hypothetical protein
LEKDKLVAKMRSSIEEKDARLEEFLTALNIDESIINENRSSSLPKNLLECCASLSASPNLIKEIPKKMTGNNFSL